MDASKLLAVFTIFNLLFLLTYSQQETDLIFKNILNFFTNMGKFVFENLNLNNLVGKFLKTIEEPLKSLITILLIIVAVFIFFLFLKNLILTIVLLIILSVIIYLIFSL